jgi:NitT/TauT family transport system ATP-binding protein
MNDMEMASQPVITVKDLVAEFPNGNGGLRVLDGLSFVVHAQEFVCVLGPSGSGKSTLLRLLAGLKRPCRGDIILHGERISGPARGVGYVFQHANLMPWRSVIQNVILPLEMIGIPHGKARSQAQKLIQLVGLEGFEQALPRELSGGMAQRVAIARALIHDPQILLLDEPFGSLDAMTRERMGAELLRIWSVYRKTVVMVTHSISEALFLADRVIVLSDRPGKINLVLDVDIPRPRANDIQYSAKFGNFARRLRAAIVPT